MKRTELRRKTPLKKQSAKALASPGTKTGRMRRSSVKPRNAKRRASEFARCYGSKERVVFVRSLPCLACIGIAPLLLFTAHGPSDNAHTVSGGKGRKADADTIVPLCRNHHQRYDEHRAPFDVREIREALQRDAAKIEALWQRECARRSAGGGAVSYER